MSDGGKNALLTASLVFSLLLCFVLPPRASLEIRNLIKYFYYFPFSKSRDAETALLGFPGRIASLVGIKRRLWDSERELAASNFKIGEMEKEIALLKKRLKTKDYHFRNYSVISVFPYAVMGDDSGIFLLKSPRAALNDAVSVFDGDKWILLGSISGKSAGVAECLLISNRFSKVAVREKSGRYWGVLTGSGEGLCEIQFIWPAVFADVKAGDEIETSGWDGKFPEGLYCGRVEKVRKAGSGYPVVFVKAGFNLNEISDIFLLKK
ncbi:MAG: rod shape-determining protein MreC [Elusimicrobia bacterium]|nr:rod shape-determining protein MreC [Elusimicrobiota bacterium]